MSPVSDNRWLHRFAVFTALATLALICVGGLVTSHGVGMSVPDWPTTYGYNMFFFPFDQWVGGIFYEHTHRLVASAVGLFTVILAVWLTVKESRAWLRRLGWIAVFAVVLQGGLGGLRVTALKDELGIFHATLAQLFLVLMSVIALFTSRWWKRSEVSPMSTRERHLRVFYFVISGLILCQLAIGATMRHQHAGLAIPDFPAAYGKLWPDMDTDSVARYNQARGEVTALNPITAFQIGLHMVHRITAVIILAGVIWAAWFTGRRVGWSSTLGRLSIGWLVLIFIQAALGMATIWTNKSADIATVHVAVGALSLVTGAGLGLMAGRRMISVSRLAKISDAAAARVEVASRPAQSVA